MATLGKLLSKRIKSLGRPIEQNAKGGNALVGRNEMPCMAKPYGDEICYATPGECVDTNHAYFQDATATLT